MPADAARPTPSDIRAPAPAAPSPTLPLVLFVLLAGAAAAAGILSYGATGADLRRQKQRELESIAALKVEELERWRDERFTDTALVVVNPFFANAIAGSASGDAAVHAPLAAWFEKLGHHGDYSGVALATPGGAMRAAHGPSARDMLDPDVVRAISAAIRDAHPVLSGVHRVGATGPLHLDLVAPVAAADGASAGAVVLRIDPYRSLFRVIQSWPTPSPTAETLLVWSDGDRVRFANELRHWTDDPLILSVPLDRRDDPAVRAVAGETGAAEGTDYRGRRVLAAMQPVPDSDWALVVKVDEAEALAPLRERAVSIAITALALVVASGAGATLWWRQQRARFDRHRYRAEVERDALLRKLEWLTRYGSDMVFLTDDRSAIVEANDCAALALGYAPGELLGMLVQQLRDPDTLADFDDRVREQREKGIARFETRYRRKDGSTFPVEVSVRTVDIDGHIHHHGIARDITERKQAEEALRHSEEKFRAAFEEAGLGIALLDPGGRLLDANRTFRRLVGAEDGDPRGRRLEDLVHPDEVAHALDDVRAVLEGRRESVEEPHRFRRRDGGSVETVLRARAIRGPAGDVPYTLAVVEDVSDRKRMEAQLLLADRMASVGTLAAGVAHEINNPLAYIVANLDFAIEELRRASASDDVVSALEEAKEGGARVREIVRDLKTFSRAQGGERALVDVREVLRSAMSLAQNEIRHRARLELELGEVPRVVGSEHRLGQVFLNVLINAAQAIPEGRAEENVIRAVTRTSPSGAAEIEVSDTGAGIKPEILDRIFDPFFTTKPVGVGTGLGLAICHGIVADLGGEIRVQSDIGRGATFTVTLPPAERGPAEPPVRLTAPLGNGRGGRILVVDDEPLVARAVARILSPPHEVVAETSARAALDRVERGDRGFDLVLCDVMMPEMTGMELHQRFAALAPDLATHVVFLTGGAFTESARQFLERVPNLRLEKPFEPSALRNLVSGMLAAR